MYHNPLIDLLLFDQWIYNMLIECQKMIIRGLGTLSYNGIVFKNGCPLIE